MSRRRIAPSRASTPRAGVRNLCNTSHECTTTSRRVKTRRTNDARDAGFEPATRRTPGTRPRAVTRSASPTLLAVSASHPPPATIASKSPSSAFFVFAGTSRLASWNLPAAGEVFEGGGDARGGPRARSAERSKPSASAATISARCTPVTSTAKTSANDSGDMTRTRYSHRRSEVLHDRRQARSNAMELAGGEGRVGTRGEVRGEGGGAGGGAGAGARALGGERERGRRGAGVVLQVRSVVRSEVRDGHHVLEPVVALHLAHGAVLRRVLHLSHPVIPRRVRELLRNLRRRAVHTHRRLHRPRARRSVDRSRGARVDRPTRT